ncbi:NAD(P)/FAD-dependent oxidoreductase [Streptomyces sp. TS71-3]|uniref:NAD(P)/FAD-dependent oxidoreductase n=1 Tax=Streptomyces sp. TS71-3 TaxID=2733862 RepID=UPI001B29BE9B|nr:NAD(P)/FAD-dependent oxidoreductase [Streptomyces sp. TS71-3]GHJ38114.1 oxidoreductase [Streptomyces sp. TS71-3]
MLEPERHADVVIIGASVAGLSAALQLARAGVQTVVLEAREHPGGRMSTEKVDGFRLDRTGRLMLASIQELRQNPGLEGLVLRPFVPGAMVHSDGRLHRTGEPLSARGHLPGSRHRGSTMGARTSARAHRQAGFGGPLEQARLAAALARLAAAPAHRLLARPERPAGQALVARGLPGRVVDGVLRPLLAALLCDPELTTSSRCADLALAAFARGRLSLTEGGADALPDRLAAALPAGTVRTGVRVTAVSTTSVTTEEHGEIGCRAVLLATGARSAAELLPGLRVPASHPVTVLHHAAPEPPFSGPALVLDADRAGPVAHTAVASEVDPSRAPAGRALVSTTVLGTPPADLDRQVRRQLGTLYGTSTARWELLGVHHDPEAVPAMPPPHDMHRPVRLLAGLYVCGEHRDTSTVQGALYSGRRAARALLADFGPSDDQTEDLLPAVA